MAKVNSGFKLDEPIRKKMEYIAEQEGTSYADLARMVFFNYIKEYEKKHGKIDDTALYQLRLKDV